MQIFLPRTSRISVLAMGKSTTLDTARLERSSSRSSLRELNRDRNCSFSETLRFFLPNALLNSQLEDNLDISLFIALYTVWSPTKWKQH